MHTNTQNSLSAKTVKCCRILGEYIYGHFGNKDSLSEMLSKTLKELLKQGDDEGVCLPGVNKEYELREVETLYSSQHHSEEDSQP